MVVSVWSNRNCLVSSIAVIIFISDWIKVPKSPLYSET